MAKATQTKSVKRTTVYLGGDPLEKPLFYVNNAEITASQFDVQLRANRMIEVTDREIKVVNQCSLAMSVETAASLVVMLSRVLQRFQEQQGSIPGFEIEEGGEVVVKQ